MCCSVLQCVAVFVAVRCCALQCVAVFVVAECESSEEAPRDDPQRSLELLLLQRVAVFVAVCCNVL